MSTTPIYISGFCSPSPRVHDPLAGRLRRRARALESDQDGLRRRHPRGTQPLAARAAAARDRLVRLAGRRMAGDPRVLVPRPLAQHGAARPAPWLGRRRRHLGPSAHAARDRLDLAPLGVAGWRRLPRRVVPRPAEGGLVSGQAPELGPPGFVAPGGAGDRRRHPGGGPDTADGLARARTDAAGRLPGRALVSGRHDAVPAPRLVARRTPLVRVRAGQPQDRGASLGLPIRQGVADRRGPQRAPPSALRIRARRTRGRARLRRADRLASAARRSLGGGLGGRRRDLARPLAVAPPGAGAHAAHHQREIDMKPTTDPWSWSTPPERVLACGCFKLKDAAWFGCDEHERPGGWESWDAYRDGWAHVECKYCHVRGFLGGIDDFTSIGFLADAGLVYAHRGCAIRHREESKPAAITHSETRPFWHRAKELFTRGL